MFVKCSSGFIVVETLADCFNRFWWRFPMSCHKRYPLAHATFHPLPFNWLGDVIRKHVFFICLRMFIWWWLSFLRSLIVFFSVGNLRFTTIHNLLNIMHNCFSCWQHSALRICRKNDKIVLFFLAWTLNADSRSCFSLVEFSLTRSMKIEEKGETGRYKNRFFSLIPCISKGLPDNHNPYFSQVPDANLTTRINKSFSTVV